MKDKNKGDEALNLEHTTVESSGKSVAIDRDDEEMKEKLNTLFKLRLLYNSGEELWQHIGKSGGGNNSFGRVGGKDAFLRRAIFYELAREWYDEMGVSIEWLLDAYSQVAKLIEKYKAYLTGGDKVNNQTAWCEQIVNVCIFDDEIDEQQQGCKREILQQLKAKDVYCLAIFLLIMLGALPQSVETRQGNVAEMRTLYERVYRFFSGVCHRNIFFVQTPRMAFFHKALKDVEEKLTRIRLIKLTIDVLSNLSVLVSTEQLAETGRREQWNQVYPNLDGYWLGKHHNEHHADYWEVEETATGYAFTHYFRKDNEDKTLHQQQFTVTFHSNGEDYACVQHPRSVAQWLNNDLLSKDDVTYLYFSFSDEDEPLLMSFDSFMMDVSWFQPMQLRRAKEGWIPPTEEGAEVINDFESYSYTFYLGLEAITPTYISVRDEAGKEYRVSVSKHEELRSCTLDDAVGIITWGDKRYVAFDNQLLYIPIKENTSDSSNDTITLL